jgi:hypothetical protein
MVHPRLALDYPMEVYMLAGWALSLEIRNFKSLGIQVPQASLQAFSRT